MPQKIEECLLLNERESDELHRSVNHFIRDGWVPQGGVCVFDDSYSQAMVKLAPDREQRLT